MKKKFTIQDIADMSNKIIFITGGNSGIGLECASVLASKGAQVIISTRSSQNGDKATESIKQLYPQAKISYVILDLANLESVKAVIYELFSTLPRLDILINNAGVMLIPKRELTQDGFECTFGTNYLGHFVLTNGLLPLLKKSSDPRVISLSSIAAYNTKINFADLQSEKKYRPMGAYKQSKLAAILFSNELSKREPSITSVAVHPGVAWTNLWRYLKIGKFIFKIFMRVMGQSIQNGALPSLFASSQATIKTGLFYGPTGAFGKGSAGVRRPPRYSRNASIASKFWDTTVEILKPWLSNEEK